MNRISMRWALIALFWMAGNASATCFEQAADYYQVPELLLRAIAHHESGMQPHRVHVNKSGSKDIGLMQINEMWLPELAEQGIYRKDLYDGCVSVFAGAWILAQNLRRAQGDVWVAVGAYNAGWKDSPARRKRKAKYVGHIQRWIERLQQQAGLERKHTDKDT